MLRLLLLAVLLLVLLRFLSRLAAVVLQALHDDVGLVGGAPLAPSIPLVRCDRCGVYVPQPVLRGQGDAALCRTCAGG